MKRLLAMEPVAVRSVVIAVFGVLGMLLNHSFEAGTVQSVIDFVLAAFSLLHVIFTRPAVTPNAKVVSEVARMGNNLTSTPEGQGL